MRKRVTLKFFVRLLWEVLKILGYIALLTVGFLVLGYILYSILDLQRSTDLLVFFVGEGFLVMILGVALMNKIPAPGRRPSGDFISWVPLRSRKENLKGAAVFVCSGLLILITGLLLGS